MGNRPVDRQGFVERSARALALAWVGWILLCAPARADAQEPAPGPQAEAIDHQAYRISLELVCDPSSCIDPAGRADVLRQWQILLRRFIGAPWVISIAAASSPHLNLDLETVPVEALASWAPFDKVWGIRITRPPAASKLVLSGREYDVVTRRLGALQTREVPSQADLPRTLLQFARDLFNPTARITGHEGGKALLLVRGAAIAPASPLGQVVAPGTVFVPLRLVALANGTVRVTRIPFSYLQVESVESSVARCAICSALQDPLTTRLAAPHTLAGVGIKPGARPSRLRFVCKADGAPAAGFTLTARPVPYGQPRELGASDRSGRIVLEPGFADGLVILRLVAGYVEPLVEFPLMPGESPDERVIPIDPLPKTVALEAQIDSLRDEVVDLVALRARLEARMKARTDGEDWAGLAEAIKEFSLLTPRDELAGRLTKLKDDAAREQAQAKKAILTRTAQAQISDLQSMIDRYLDDDAFKAYSEALNDSKSKSGAAAKAKAATRSAAQVKAALKSAPDRSAPAPGATRSVPPAPATAQAAPPAAAPVAAQPKSAPSGRKSAMP